jgi:cbb3-type cytochrome oxidase subunit 3
MRQFASEFFEQSPMLLYPVIALVLFFIVFLGVLVRVMRMKASEADQRARIPLEEELEVPHE